MSPNSKSKSKASPIRINEVIDFHPLVAKWLEQNSYTFKHHYKIATAGYVDFLATHSDGHQMLVEAKTARGYVKNGIVQVSAYQMQLPNAKAVVATAECFLKDGDLELAARNGVEIVLIALPPELTTPKPAAKITSEPVEYFSILCPNCRNWHFRYNPQTPEQYADHINAEYERQKAEGTLVKMLF